MTEKSTNPFKKIINSLFSPEPNHQVAIHKEVSNLPTPATVSNNSASTLESKQEDRVIPPTHAPDYTTPSELSRTLHDIIQQVPACDALAYVDITQGQLIGIETKDTMPDGVYQLVATATMELFTAPNVIKVSDIFKAKKGMSESHSNFNEIIVHGDGNIYVFIRAQSRADRVGVFSCDSSVSSGMVLHHARQLMPQIESAAEINATDN